MERKKNVQEIKRLMQKRRVSEETCQTLSRYLISKGISRSLSEELALQFGENELLNLIVTLAKKLNVAAPLSFTDAHRVALVGPTGVGKTTTIIKLAKHYLREGKKVAILSLDQQKTFSLKEISSQLENVTVSTQIEELKGHDLLLIDTEGCNFYEPTRVERIGEKLASLENVEILLTLSAASKEVDLYGAIHQFSSLQPKGLVFTKLDETLQPGVMVNLCQKTPLPIHYIAFGYPLPGEVQIADAHKIVHKILTDFNQDEFQFLRQLVLE